MLKKYRSTLSSIQFNIKILIQIQLYTVTKSGIVSETRFDEMLRISAPPVNVSLDDITRTTGTLHMNLMTPVRFARLSNVGAEHFETIDIDNLWECARSV